MFALIIINENNDPRLFSDSSTSIDILLPYISNSIIIIIIILTRNKQLHQEAQGIYNIKKIIASLPRITQMLQVRVITAN